MAQSKSAPAKSGFKLKPSLDWLLIFVPISMALHYGWIPKNDTALFICSCLAIIPLAGWMGHATEHLAEKVGDGVGGLLNATFGNAAELIIALVALQKGLTGVVKASLTGSIIGNLLLVLGASMLAGGWKNKEQKFNQTAARSSVTSLLLAGGALIIPSVFHEVAGQKNAWTPDKEQALSTAIALVLLATYAANLLFSLKTHKSLFTGHAGAQANAQAKKDDDENHESWPMKKSVGILLVATIFVALVSEYLVGSVEAARQQLGLTEVFVGVIVVAIIGNAAEHSSAILMALKNKMDLSLGIAIGSSLQIALFVAPVLILASNFIGPHPMDLEFTVPEIVAVLLAIVVTGQICGDGESNWLEGVQLLSFYLVLGILFYFLPELHHSVEGAAGTASNGAPLAAGGH